MSEAICSSDLVEVLYTSVVIGQRLRKNRKKIYLESHSVYEIRYTRCLGCLITGTGINKKTNGREMSWSIVGGNTNPVGQSSNLYVRWNGRA